MQAETKVGRREYRQRFDEDVGRGFVSREVWVKLVSVDFDRVQARWRDLVSKL